MVSQTLKSFKEFASCSDFETALRGWFQQSPNSRSLRGTREEVKALSAYVKSMVIKET